MNLVHTLVIISYNHEQWIKCALDSVLQLSEKPDEIFILDDCSTDNTFNILMEYDISYPNFFKIIQNNENLGLFENIKKARSLGSGHLVSLLSGDDMLNKHTFKAMNDTICDKKIDLINGKFIVITDTELLWPNGKRTKWSNSEVCRNSTFFSRVRGSLSYRAIGISRSLIDSIPSEAEIAEKTPEVGLFADYIKGFEEIIEAEQIFYCAYAASVYRIDTGIVSQTDRKLLASQKINAMNYVLEKHASKFSKLDKNYINLLLRSEKIKLNYDVESFLKLSFLIMYNIGNHAENSNKNAIYASLIPLKYHSYLRGLRAFLQRLSK